MNRACLSVLLILSALGLTCQGGWAATESVLNVMTDQDHLNVGETLEIEVRLWSVMEGRVLPPLGGELTVAVIDALRGVAVRSFKAEPDGSARLFRVAWSPAEAGGYRIVARYESPATGKQIAAETQVTVGLGLSPGAGRSPQPEASPTSTSLPATPAVPPTTSATAPVFEPAVTAPSVQKGVPTRVVLRIEPGTDRGEYVVRIFVTTDAGAPVDRGDVLVTVGRGSLSRGGGTQTLVGLDSRGRASLSWSFSQSRNREELITVDYLGGWSSGRECAPSYSSLNLKRSATDQIVAAATTASPPVAAATTSSPLSATVPPPTFPPVTTTTPPPTMQRTIRGQSVTNTLGMVFRLIPAGGFDMGSPGGRNAPRFTAPVHRVEIGRPFWMGVYEVTQEQWGKVMGSRPAKFRGDPRLPVERVSPVQAAEFIKRLNAREGTTAYRLPTEAEWEYACRAGTRDPWSFGSRPEQLGRFAWWISNSGLKTHPVGLLEPNPWDLFDMHGNVAELCSDWFDQGYYAQSPGKDPQGPDRGTHRVGRGGSWLSGPVRLRCAARVMAEPGPSLGFRLARDR